MVSTKICKWGSSAAVRLPVTIMKAAQLEIGSRITIEVVEEGILLKRHSTPEASDTTPEHPAPTK